MCLTHQLLYTICAPSYGTKNSSRLQQQCAQIFSVWFDFQEDLDHEKRDDYRFLSLKIVRILYRVVLLL